MHTGLCTYYLMSSPDRLFFFKKKAALLTDTTFFVFTTNRKKLKSESDDKLQIGNSIYSIRFERRDTFEKFGSKYWFHLEDAIDDCPEYLVHFPTFQK